jgi:peptidoglycan-N-acetylglucosamine deacetylase
MRITLFRFACIGLAPFALLTIATPAAGCPGNPNAIGTSRTIVVDPAEHRKIGTMNYSETLPLVDQEVVLTFDDGPLPPHTNRILDILAAECVKATYFIVGTMARANPELVRRVHEHGHTVGTHSMSHPNPFRTQGFDESKAQVDGGITATAAALGDGKKLAPFFRFPGFGRTGPVEAYVASRGLMVWGADVPADDWHRISGREVAERAIRRLEAKGKGILLLHDIHARTVEALPLILAGLKARGFRIVHVEYSTATRPATVTAAKDWRLHPRSKSASQAASQPVVLRQKTAMAGDLDLSLLQSKPASEPRPISEPQPAKEKSIGQRITAVLQKHAPPPPDSRGKRGRGPTPDIHAAR